MLLTQPCQSTGGYKLPVQQKIRFTVNYIRELKKWSDSRLMYSREIEIICLGAVMVKSMVKVLRSL